MHTYCWLIYMTVCVKHFDRCQGSGHCGRRHKPSGRGEDWSHILTFNLSVTSPLTATGLQWQNIALVHRRWRLRVLTKWYVAEDTGLLSYTPDNGCHLFAAHSLDGVLTCPMRSPWVGVRFVGINLYSLSILFHFSLYKLLNTYIKMVIYKVK
jgi:hypothetical protein